MMRGVLLLGDVDDVLLDSLLVKESGSLKEGKELVLDTKYYRACVKLESLKSLEEVEEEWTSKVATVGAVIYNYDGEFRSLHELGKQMARWRPEVQVVVCRRLERSQDWCESLRRFCARERMELIELEPDEETMEELNECCELYGIPRIRQVLEAGNWDDKIMKKNPLGLDERRDCTENSLPSNSVAKNSFEDSFDEEEIGFDDCDMTEEDKEMIVKLFGGPKVLFDSLVKDVDIPDPKVIEYFKQETEKLKRQNKLAAKKRKKKKSKAATASEFGEFVDADGSAQTLSSVVTESSSNMSSPNNEAVAICANGHEISEKKTVQEPSGDNDKSFPQISKESSRQLSDVARSMIDRLSSKDTAEQETNWANKIDVVRSALSKMPFGPERQNLAADTMADVIKSFGYDIFNGSSDDEPHSEVSQDV